MFDYVKERILISAVLMNFKLPSNHMKPMLFAWGNDASLGSYASVLFKINISL